MRCPQASLQSNPARSVEGDIGRRKMRYKRAAMDWAARHAKARRDTPDRLGNRDMNRIRRAAGLAACTASAGLLLVAAAAGTGYAPTRAAAATAAAPKVTGAWVRLPAVAANPGAAYLTITGGPAGDTLVEASSPLAGRVELHSMEMKGGIMKMSTLDNVAVGPGATVKFAPGGNHLMLFGLLPAAKAGADMPIALRFAKAGTVMVNARVYAAGSPGPDAGHAGH